MESIRVRDFAKFILPSAFGASLFLLPVPTGAGTEILSGMLVSALKTILGGLLVPTLVGGMVVSAALSLIHRVRPLRFIASHPKLNEIFSPRLGWLVIRIVGALLALAVVFGFGPEWLVSEDTGGNMLYTVIPTCSLWYIVGGVFLPFLTDYGFIDFFGAFFRKYARPLFKIPGRAMIDCLSSWLGSSVCGTYLTISQYERGFYTGREAVTVISCFSLLSVSFCSMIASMLGLQSMFASFYGTIVIAGLICALILPRLWPIRSIPDTYYADMDGLIDEETPDGMGRLSWAFKSALRRAEGAPSFFATLAKGSLNALDMLVSTLPSIMTIGTLALVVATKTNLFGYLSIPLVPYLQLVGIPEASTVASTILVGFADQFATVILGTMVSSVQLRFLIGCLSILQILYMTDIGSLILTSKVPFKFWQIFLVYLERILICVPVVRLCAHLFGVV